MKSIQYLRISGLAVIIPAAGLALAAPEAAADNRPKVAIVAAADFDTSSAYFTDPRDKLLATEAFSEVGIINAFLGTPTLAQLQQYDAVLVWSVMDFANWINIGNVMADYVDQGGGVVVAVFANTLGDFYRLGGRWITGDYEIIPGDGGTLSTGGAQSLGTLLIPGHPILDGVGSFSGGTRSFRPTSTALTPHGVKVAEWTDGKTLIAVSSQFPNRVDLGLYPPSDQIASWAAGLWWDANTDGGRLMANALLYAADAISDPCYADCDGNEALNIDDFLCFINEFSQAQGLPTAQQINHYANCDGSTNTPVLTIDDFLCFINEFAQGCP